MVRYPGKLQRSGFGGRMEGRDISPSAESGIGFTQAAALNEVMVLIKETMGRRLSS